MTYLLKIATMDFKDSCKMMCERISKLKSQIATEEATKNAFIMPFIQMLGYDVFNPMEVVPELNCDLVRKKGDKIDYAIMKDGEATMLIECKHWQQDLNLHDTQLQKYFVASKARFGVLTNGIIYRFYTDLVKPNIMDNTPFLEVDFESIKDADVEELKKFHKSYFDIENILSTASELKYTSELKAVVKSEFNSPSPDMVKMLARRVYDGVITQRVLEQFTELVRRSFADHINDVMAERLNVVIKSAENKNTQNEPTAETTPAISEDVPESDNRIVTTEEELEGYYIVKSICRNVLPGERITYRDAISYFSIFADDNNRKPICRLHFNNPSNKRIEIISENGDSRREKIDTLDDIYKYQEELRLIAAKYK